MSFFRKETDLIRAFYAADKDGDGALDLSEYVSMFHEQVSFSDAVKMQSRISFRSRFLMEEHEKAEKGERYLKFFHLEKWP